MLIKIMMDDPAIQKLVELCHQPVILSNRPQTGTEDVFLRPCSAHIKVVLPTPWRSDLDIESAYRSRDCLSLRDQSALVATAAAGEVAIGETQS